MKRTVNQPTWLALFLLLGLALALRLWRLGDAPPGLSHDEAYDALNALDVLAGRWPLFFESNNGREALFMYLVALSFAAFGVGTFQLRLVSALAGVAAVGLLYLLARDLGERTRLGRRLALLPAALLAVSFWPLFDSRVGLRASLLPALATLVAWGLWRWLGAARAGRTGRALGWAALAGLALGLTLNTYTPARFLPLLPPLFAASLVALRALSWRRALAGLAACLAVAALVFAPLAAYFLAHPGTFGSRAGQVNDLRFILQEGDFGPLLEDTLNTLAMFSAKGDPSSRYSLAGRPVFDPVGSALFHLGLLFCLLALARGVRRRPAPGAADALAGEPPAAALLVLWLGVGLLPSATTGESPHFLRAIGAQPVSFLLPAVGLAAAGAWLGRWRPALSSARALGAAGALLVALSAALGLRDYLVVWQADAEARRIYGAATAAASRRLAGVQDVPAERTFVAAEYPADLDRAVLDVLRGRRPPEVSWLDGRTSLVFPAGGPATYLLPRTARPPAEVLARFFPEATGDDELWSGRLAGPPALAPARRESARLDSYLELLGYDLPSEVAAGERLRVTLYWRLRERPPADLSLFVHLIGELATLWGQQDGLGYPRDQWQPGDLLVQWHDVPVPVGAPPVDYRVEAGAYYRDDGRHLAVRTGSADQPPADRLPLGVVRVARPTAPAAPPPAATPVDVRLGDAVRLRGFELSARRPTAGDSLRLTLYWESLAPAGADYTVFVHLAGEDQRPLAQADYPPARGAFPTGAWQPGDLVRDPHELALPAALRPGRYWLLVGLYRPDTGARLAAAGPPRSPTERLGVWLERRTPYRAGPRAEGDHVVLTAVDVRERGR